MSESEGIPDGWEEGYVEANGIDMHYVRTGGNGPPFVVSHGVTDDGRCRVHLARDLSEYDVVLYDARGHGRSDAPKEGYDAGTRAADLVGVIEALDLGDPYLFGHSMGADTVAVAAAHHPDLPEAVVLEDPAGMLRRGDGSEADDDGGSPGDDIVERIEWWQSHTRDELLEADDWFRELVESDRGELASRLAEARLRLSPNVAGVFESDFVDPETVYGDIEVPTLILKADADEEERRRDRTLASHLPDGRIVHVDGAGHTVFWDERAAATRELRNFLAEI